MGTFHVELTVKNLHEPGRQRTVPVPVDTGATYTTLPWDVVDALDCQPIGTRRVLLANLLSYRPERGSGLPGRGHVGRAGTGSSPGGKKTGASPKLSHQHPIPPRTLNSQISPSGLLTPIRKSSGYECVGSGLMRSDTSIAAEFISDRG